MKSGEELLISDGNGTDHLCRIRELDEERIVCEILDVCASRTEPSAKFYLFQGLPKADKLEQIIQKAVELGVYEIIPVEMSRSVVRYDEKKKKAKRERWQKIAESAAKQSKRAIIPEVKDIMDMETALSYAADREQMDRIFVPYENFKDMTLTRKKLSMIRAGMKVAIFIGPEGGFDRREIGMALQKGGDLLSLGNRILRTETAPLMLLSVLTFALEE